MVVLVDCVPALSLVAHGGDDASIGLAVYSRLSGFRRHYAVRAA